MGNRKPKAVDPMCLEVAEHFLPRGCTKTQELAALVQTTIEDWIAYEAAHDPASDISQMEGCTCRWVGHGNDPDAHVRRDEWCPLHGRDPDAEMEARRDIA